MLPSDDPSSDFARVDKVNMTGKAHGVDLDIDPTQRAFYDVCVIEIPKPRWTADDQKVFSIEKPDDVVMTAKDRAYTPPIWDTR